ncbi:hypothetical protein ACFXO9_31575 [Nocardia tengchongensis]|uniref:hypothetical protein n=1 Tax=Nocardia tengchongensis TaxID=2055889 RepID=UPI0036C3C603
MPDIDRILQLTRKALDDFEEPGKSVAAAVRQAHRIAVHRHDYAAQTWLLLQLQDNSSGTSQREELLKLLNQLKALLGEEEGSRVYKQQVHCFFETRLMADGKNTSGRFVEQIEAHLAQVEQVYAEYGNIPANLTPIDTYVYAREHESAQAKLIPQLDEQRQIIARIKQQVYTYLVETEADLETGSAESPFFDQVQAHINGLLAKYAPDAVQNFIGAQERIISGGPEDISHALTSCRRMIKSLADALYPPSEPATGIDGVSRPMTNDAYRNRLVQYVSEQVGKHENGPVLTALITEFGSRLKALDALTSKGVHDEASLLEARTCVAQTYLLAGDLLSIAEKASDPVTQAS